MPSNCAFPKHRSMKLHRTRWCNGPDGPVRSRNSTLADKAVKRAKRKEQAVAMPHVTLNGHIIENVLSFDYLGSRVSGDGSDSADIQHRMVIAQERFSSLHNIWRDHRLSRAMKIDMYSSSVCSTFTHGSETWTLESAALKSVNGFKSRNLYRITSRSYREEAVEPSFNLVRAVRQRRKRWLGHILRMPEHRLLRRTVCSLATNAPPYPSGSIFMDCDGPLRELTESAEDRKAWQASVMYI